MECDAVSDLYSVDLVLKLEEKGLNQKQIQAVLNIFDPILRNAAHNGYWEARVSEGITEE